MADGFSFNLITEPWDEMQRELEIASDRATMFALRATGRAVVRAARAKAPVYSGPDPRATAESGQYRRSIQSGRTITRGGGNYELHVKPTGSIRKGTHVHRTSEGELRGVPLYAKKLEAMYGVMEAGVDDAEAQALEIYEAAYAKAFAKYAP
jgi:hypothetical protein